MSNDARLLLQAEAQKKSGWVAALLNLFLPGAGYIYCGRWILGIIAFLFAIGVAAITYGFGWPAFCFVVFIDGFLCAGRYNKKMIMKILADNPPPASGAAA